MSSSILNNENFVSVLPRIIDPGMQFTKESIQNSNVKNITDNKLSISKSSPILEKKENLDIEQSPKGNSFLSDYKYVILMIIISIIVIIIIYFIYKYFDTLNEKNNLKENNNLDIKGNDKLLTKDVKDAKDENVKEYISNYIINDDENDNLEDDEEDLKEDNTTNNIDVVDVISNVNTPNENTTIPIIVKPLYNDSNTKTVLGGKLAIGINIPLSDNILNNKNVNLESENIDFLINSLNPKENTDILNKNTKEEYDSDNMAIFEELDNDTNSDNNDDSDDEDIKEINKQILDKFDNNETEDILDDDLKYFKKFAQK